MTDYERSSALDMSSDGQWVVGFAYRAADQSLPYSEFQVVTGGSIEIVPYFWNVDTHSTLAVIWDDSGRVFELQSLLENLHGLRSWFDGWTLTSASLISDDGLVLAGQGVNPDGDPEVWLVRLDKPLTAPEPSSLVLLALGLPLGFIRAHRH
jgi:hypothetical protein